MGQVGTPAASCEVLAVPSTTTFAHARFLCSATATAKECEVWYFKTKASSTAAADSRTVIPFWSRAWNEGMALLPPPSMLASSRSASPSCGSAG